MYSTIRPHFDSKFGPINAEFRIENEECDQIYIGVFIFIFFYQFFLSIDNTKIILKFFECKSMTRKYIKIQQIEFIDC